MRYLLVVITSMLLSCQFGAEQVVENQKLKLQLLETEKELVKIKLDEDRYLIHIVYFNLKPEADKLFFVDALEKLGDIPSVRDLEVGHFKDLSDERAMSDFEIMMQMAFDSEKDYTTYQDHPIHLELKKLATKFVSAPPVTYDYLVAK